MKWEYLIFMISALIVITSFVQRKYSENSTNGVKTIHEKTLYTITIILVLLFPIFEIFMKNMIDEEKFKYLSIVFLITIIILSAIYEYKKKSQ